MCGIAGFSLKKGAVSSKRLKLFAQALAHRGPDGEGYFKHKNIGLVHTRLSIIDLAGGAQPIHAADAGCIVGNGEIYNYKDLQQRLVAQGVELQSDSDTEPALHYALSEGANFVQKLHGMYALAVWDAARNQLLLARDPFGIKPLYYSETAEGLAFASEPAALVKAGWVSAAVNNDVLPGLLHRQYSGGDEILFKGINRVAPGEVLVVQDGAIVARHQHKPALKPIQKIGEIEALERLDALFTQAIDAHVQSDVPYGAFLSGGVDSSAMVLKMYERVGDVRTYTAGFGSQTVRDERAQASVVANRVGARQSEVSFNEEDFWHYLPIMAASMDDLVADYAALPLMKLAERASADVKVILSGEGGDELFAGYGRYRSGLFRPKFRRMGDVAAARGLFRPEIVRWQEETLAINSAFSPLQQRQFADIQDWLPDNLFTKVDRCLMRYGVEGRVPYLDDELASFAFSLPDNLKQHGKHGKYLLKKWLDSRLPEADVWAKKRGFSVPVAAWLANRQAQWGPYLAQHEAVNMVADQAKLANMLAKPLSKKQAKLCFTLLCFALWYDAQVTGEIKLPFARAA